MAIKEASKPIFDTGSGDHAPELYDHEGIAPALNGFEAVQDEHIDFYHQEGYLAIDNAFTPEETADALQGLVDLVMGRNPEFKHIVFEGAAKKNLGTLGEKERQDAVRKIHRFVNYDKRLRALAEHSALCSLLRRLLGYTPELFQDMALMKPPRLGREKPWHQDQAYFNFSLGTPVAGVWIALDEATLDNGCMRIMPGKHRNGPVIHFKRRDWQICDTEIMGKKCVAVPLRPGGILIFDGLLPHGTPTNHSPLRRRALQYHYLPEGTEKTTQEERLAIFGSEGKDVEC